MSADKTYGKGSCPNCGNEEGPHELGRVLAEYSDGTLFSVLNEKHCQKCGAYLDSFFVNSFCVSVIREESKRHDV